MRVGIFGGSFNPPHMGHLNSLNTVLKKAGLDQIRVVPAAQNPLKLPIEGPSPEDRLEMTRKALESYGAAFVVDEQEIQRGGLSYTIDTVLNIRKEVSAEDLYLIIGLDQLESFDEWHKAKEILKETNLIVTSRPGFQFPSSEAELPAVLSGLVEEFDFNFIELKSGRSIQFLKLQDVEVSATELRKWLRTGKNVSKYIPLSVESYIREKGLYKNLGDRIGDYQKFTQFCAQTLYDKKGINIKGFDLRKLSAPSEFTLIASGTSTRHTSALGENIIRAVKEEYNVHPQSIEGIDEGRWVVLDYGSLIVHLFYDFVRQEYSLENLWKEGSDMGLKDEAPARS